MPEFCRFNGVINSGQVIRYEIASDADGNEYFKEVGVLDKSFAQAHFDTQIRLQSGKKIPNSNPPQGYYGLFQYQQVPTDPSPRTTIIEVPRETVKNPDFKKRSMRGEIIVSPMKVGKLVITETPYFRNQNAVNWDQHARYLENDPTLTHKTLSGTTCAVLGGQYVRGSLFLAVDIVFGGDYGYMPFDKSRYVALLQGREIDDKLITTAAAEINEATMDLLTTLAELPETVKMVRDALSFLGNKLKAFKTAEERLKKKLLKEGIPLNEAQAIDALSSLWLKWRYGIMPLYYTLEDIKDVLKDKFAAEYVKSSTTKHHDFEPEEGFQGAWSLVDSCWMKRRFDPSDMTAQFRRVFGMNPFVTAWELTTLSFVVDWAINVGDVISAMSPIPSLEEKATISWKNSVTGTITKPQYPLGSVDIDLSYYEIIPINYQDHVSLSFEPLMTTKRKLDALALGWSFSRSFFRKLK